MYYFLFTDYLIFAFYDREIFLSFLVVSTEFYIIFVFYFCRVMDGILYPGQVQEKEKAQRDFESAKRKGLSAGHVAQK